MAIYITDSDEAVYSNIDKINEFMNSLYTRLASVSCNGRYSSYSADSPIALVFDSSPTLIIQLINQSLISFSNQHSGLFEQCTKVDYKVAKGSTFSKEFITVYVGGVVLQDSDFDLVVTIIRNFGSEYFTVNIEAVLENQHE